MTARHETTEDIISRSADLKVTMTHGQKITYEMGNAKQPVGLRKMNITAEAVRQVRQVIAARSRSSIMACDLPELPEPNRRERRKAKAIARGRK